MKKLLLQILLVFSFFHVTNAFADTTYIKGTIKKDEGTISIRNSCNTNYSILKDDEGINISIRYPETFEILSQKGDLYEIYFQYKGFYYVGCTRVSYVDKEEYIVTDATVNEMLNAGFNDTYAKKLAILKTIHPNWNFIKYDTGLTWNEVIAGESQYINRNLISGSNTSLRSTADGAYSNGVWNTFSGPGWYAASVQTIKYYMDPRNFLNDGHVFMFEKLSYEENNHTSAAEIGRASCRERV